MLGIRPVEQVDRVPRHTSHHRVDGEGDLWRQTGERRRLAEAERGDVEFQLGAPAQWRTSHEQAGHHRPCGPAQHQRDPLLLRAAGVQRALQDRFEFGGGFGQVRELVEDDRGRLAPRR